MILSLLVWFPIFGGLSLLIWGRRVPNLLSIFSLAITGVTFLLSLFLAFRFDFTTHHMQFVEKMPWIENLSIQYALGVDGIALPLIMLTSLMGFLVCLVAKHSIKERLSHYFAAFLLMVGFMNGVFASLDAILFYVFWEGMLIPMFLIIGIWGGPNRVYAAIKFFLYTFLGSVLMLLALIYLYSESGSFVIERFYQLPLSQSAQILIFIAFTLAFAVKVPMWPVHTWLPDAHVEAPTGGSVILAAILLKMGGYGFVRFALPIVPDACRLLSELMIALSLIAVVYIGFVALVQQDMKKLIAYSSIAHMGFVTLGLFMTYKIFSVSVPYYAEMGIQGALVQMISHGFVSAALFFGVGVLYDRIHSREIRDYGGVAGVMPMFSAIFMLFAMANVGLPGTSGFVGEWMVILASFRASFGIAFLASLTLILGAAYTLWMMKRVFFGEVIHAKVASLRDLNREEKLVLWVLAGGVLLLGIYPAPLLEMMQPSVKHLIDLMLVTKL